MLGVYMEAHNPWWFGETHPKYLEWESSEIKWTPRLINEFRIKPFSLNFIVGPRQIGKTTAIAIYIHKNLLKRLKPEAIFYFACDEISDFRELGEILDNYLSFRESRGVKSSIIFLDEITFVDEWWRALKSRIDLGKLSKDVIFVSGSASLELIAGKERFPGRRGHGRDHYALPVSFDEFVSQIKKIPVKKYDFSKNIIDNALKANKLLKRELTETFEIYLRTGGFPLAIKEFLTSGKTWNAYKTYMDWLKTDIVRTRKSEKTTKEILSYILNARLTPISWNNIAKETSISSPNTIRSYIEFLEDLFILKVLYWIGTDGKIMPRKNKKIHVTDPFLYDALAKWTRVNIFDEQKVESILAMHLNRIGDIFYWKNSTEVDVILKYEGKLLGFEAKWSIKTPGRRPFNTRILDKKTIPIFLASIKWQSKQL